MRSTSPKFDALQSNLGEAWRWTIKRPAGRKSAGRGFAPTALSGTFAKTMRSTSPKFDWGAPNLGEAWRWHCTGKENALRPFGASPRGGVECIIA